MNDTLYEEPDCGAHVPHEGVCTLCGAEPRWVLPVEIDYEAAANSHGIPLLEAIDIVNLALGIGGDDA